ncbi:MAG TPA: hypothetical protein PKC45_13655 [Gemmatales bacterium]|nr:hypothetical protein [Gemmatales bacterium]
MRMAKDLLSYWKPKTVDDMLAKGGAQLHAASDQYDRVRDGDTVWIVTIRSGMLKLVTCINVWRVTGQADAAQLLGVPADELWEAEYHIVAAAENAREIAERDIHSFAPQLRFKSTGGNDRLTLNEDGTVNAAQLQAMRVLTPESAALLATVL